jgi:MFS family permease
VARAIIGPMSSPKPAATSGRSTAVVVLCLVQFVDVLGVTSAVTAIPAMLAGVGADASLAGPVATAYAMFFGGLLVLGARLGQRYGHRNVLLAGLATFVVASCLGAFAFSGWQLVLARSLQGAASAMSVPAALSLLLAQTPSRDERSRALAMWSAAGAAAGATGFFLGGAATELLGWQAVFWVNVPVGLVLVLAVATLVRVVLPRDRDLSLDAFGATLLVAAVMALVVSAALLEHESSRLLGLGSLAISAVVIVLLALWLRRAVDPVIPLSSLRQPQLLIGIIGSFVNTATTSSTGVLLTLDLQDRQGLGPLMAGLVLLPVSVAVIIGSTLASYVLRRHSRLLAITSGLGLIGVGNAVAAFSIGSVPGVVVGIALVGLGLGLSSVGCTDIGTDVGVEHTSTATGLLNTGAQLGTALGVALLVLVATGEAYGHLPGTTVALSVAAAAAVVTSVVLGRWVNRVERQAPCAPVAACACSSCGSEVMPRKLK